MNRGRKIVIAGSADFWEEAAVWKARLELAGYEVVAWIVREEGVANWRELYEDFYAKMDEADDIFVLNMDKKGVAGYIGYETFAELSKMVLRRQAGRDARVYLYQWPGEECGCYQEIMEMKEAGWVKVWQEPSFDGGASQFVYTAYSKHNFYARQIISAFTFSQGKTPLNPFMNWGYFLDDLVPREQVRAANEQLIRASGELWQFGEVSDGCLREIELATELGMPVRFFTVEGKVEEIKEVLDLSEVEFEEEVLRMGGVDEFVKKMRRYVVSKIGK